MRILVSACLLGVNCKYSGGNNESAAVLALLQSGAHTLVPVCPEQKDFFGYTREDADGKYYVEINLSAHELERPVEMNGTLLLGSYGTAEKALRPFEANLYRLR